MLDTAFAGKFCVIEKRHSFRCFSICSVMLNQLCNHNRVLGNLMLPFCILDNNIITKEDMIIILIYTIKARYHN